MSELENFRPSVVLYRFANAQNQKVVSKSKLNHETLESKSRIQDAVIGTLILIHAALETEVRWLNEYYRLEDFKWPDESLKALRNIASANGRDNNFNYPAEFIERFKVINYWRNYFQHGGDSSINNLKKIDPLIGLKNLTPELSQEALDLADEFFEFLSHVTGSQRIGPATVSWVNPSETL